MNSAEITDALRENLIDSIIEVKSPDNTHFEALIVSDQFIDKTRLKRHQIIYECLGDAVGAEIHALSIRAYTKEEWNKLNQCKS
tara:strand:- start:230 stop:481 length:252 start_codon:yes stop_codon:yes gene_type:complete